MKVLIGANKADAEATWQYQSQLWECVKIGHGGKVMGYQFDDVEISLLARKELTKAVKLLRWYDEAILCRFKETPQELVDLLGLSPDAAAEEEVKQQPHERRQH